MITQTQINQIIIGVILILVGVPVYLRYSPEHELTRVRREIIHQEGLFARRLRYPEVFLARFLRRIRQLINRI
jgi:hypothetical protein